ncbi:hypothetical protein [Streptomyces aidingensis]|uniref:Secreted protein n=1 Tax=Streptomyces aidingensis TaxID=910347 RepID=A0A1I1NER2_9ACTN|nr:hypothetical protein [Streptomyces aidingensis]SFC93263.1 hypothetical protein SAMN05421773_107253 [Streptomyces aidingensis]
MRSMRGRVVLTVCAGLMAVGSGGVASADSNDNLADPPMMCGTSPLSVTGDARPCVTEQKVKQRMVKHHTESFDIVDFADVLTPLDGLLG